jgi:hypothetical protein
MDAHSCRLEDAEAFLDRPLGFQFRVIEFDPTSRLDESDEREIQEGQKQSGLSQS